MIEEHPTWKIHDSSKINEFMTCPRSYFWKYVLGWQLEEGNHLNRHLIFGECWHKALEYCYRTGWTPDNMVAATEIATDYYRKFYDPITDGERKPKTPANILPALLYYYESFIQNGHDRWNVVHTEVAGSAWLDEKRKIQFRMDLIVQRQDDGKYMIVEHKTGSRDDNSWTDKWSVAFQLGTYYYALSLMYPPEQVYGALVNGMIFYNNQKEPFRYKRVPIEKPLPHLQMWYWTCQHYMDMIEWEFERLAEGKESDPVMMAFPMNTESCVKYYGCPYLVYCGARPNPLQNPVLAYPMEKRWWNPADFEITAQKVVHLTRE